jgi:hypothetical protein
MDTESLEKPSHLTREKLERTRQLMDKAATDARCIGYEHLIPGLVLPDEDDRHVLASAIRCGASLIVTCNLADFPADALASSTSRPSIRMNSFFISSISHPASSSKQRKTIESV